MAPKATRQPPPTFTQRHAENISKLKLILIVVCLVAIPVTFWWNHQDVGSIGNRVTKIESPCQRYGSDSKLCQEAFETAVLSITHRIACYIDHESGRPFKPSCAGVHLQIEIPTSSPPTGGSHPAASAGQGGGAETTGNPGSSQPGPHQGGGGGSTEVAPGGGGHDKSPEKLPPSKGGGSYPPPRRPPRARPSPPPRPERTTEPTVGEPAPEAPPAPVREAVGGVVEEAGHTVAGTVEGVTGTTCSLAKVLCSE